jgi:lysyl-tRNA synthetase class 2
MTAARSGGRERFAGRVLDVRGERILLGTALERSWCDLAPSSPVPSLGDWCLVEATEAGFVIAERAPGREPAQGSEAQRLLWGGLGERLQARARALRAVREYFEASAFLEVETPIRVTTPGLDFHVDALTAEGGWLVTSPEFHMKRLVVGGLRRVYQLVRCFRREELGPWHEPEFTMLEWYRAFEDYEAVMADTEAVVERVVDALHGSTPLRTPACPLRVKPPFERVTVREAFRLYAGIADACDLAESDEGRFFEVLVSQVEPALARAERPVFLLEYPISQASLARAVPGDPRVAERFELYLGGVELCNGFGELTDPREQRLRFEADQAARAARGRPVYPLDERFLSALEEGMPRTSGNALGFDRLVALALGAQGIAEVQAFPSAHR